MMYVSERKAIRVGLNTKCFASQLKHAVCKFCFTIKYMRATFSEKQVVKTLIIISLKCLFLGTTISMPYNLKSIIGMKANNNYKLISKLSMLNI